MIRDLRTILEGWEYEPGKISVRKIIGRDGREKIQTRIDLGVLQLECQGRPDGERPHGCESLLHYHEQRLRDHLEIYGNDEDFVLSPEDCRDLRHEAYLYYQRYLSSFVLEEYAAVVTDTTRNLRMTELCERYAAREADRTAVRSQKAYVLMMCGRAKAYLALGNGEHDVAIRLVDEAIAALAALADNDVADACPREVRTLRGLRDEIIQKMPSDAPLKLEAALRAALACEDYEQAAKIRDRLARRRPSPSGV